MIEPANSSSPEETKRIVEWYMGLARDPVNVSASPADGETIDLPDTDSDIFVNITPSSDLQSINVTLPSDSSSRDNQRLIMRSSRNINEINVVGADTIDNSIVMLSAGSVTVFFKFASNLWSRTV